MEKKIMEKKVEQKEDFCMACLAVPLALAGAGVAGAGGAKKGMAFKK